MLSESDVTQLRSQLTLAEVAGASSVSVSSEVLAALLTSHETAEALSTKIEIGPDVEALVIRWGGPLESMEEDAAGLGDQIRDAVGRPLPVILTADPVGALEMRPITRFKERVRARLATIEAMCLPAQSFEHTIHSNIYRGLREAFDIFEEEFSVTDRRPDVDEGRRSQ